MIKLKSLIKENNAVDTIRPKDIFNFYFLWHIATDQPHLVQTPYGKEIMDHYLRHWKDKYVKLFKQLALIQIRKYIERKRIDPDFPPDQPKDNASAQELLALMKKTFRSDMQRRNEKWIMMLEFVVNLESSSASKDIFLWINQLFNAVHNTQTKIMDKFPNYYSELSKAFNTMDNATNINTLQHLVDKDIRDLQNQQQEQI